MPLDDHNLPLMFLSARTPQELRIEMMKTNRQFSRRFHYSIPTFAEKKWWTWFELREKDKQEAENATE